MSRLDYVTIAIVAVCIAALIFLVYKTTNLLSKGEAGSVEPTEEGAELGDTTENYYDMAGGGLSDQEEEPGSASDENVGDDQLNYFEEDERNDFQEDQAAAESTTGGVEEESAPETFSSSSPGGSGNYLVIAGSFRIRSNAENMVKKLRNLGYSEAEVGVLNRGAYAIAVANRFESESDARALVSELKRDHGVDAYVHLKREQ